MQQCCNAFTKNFYVFGDKYYQGLMNLLEFKVKHIVKLGSFEIERGVCKICGRHWRKEFEMLGHQDAELRLFPEPWRN